METIYSVDKLFHALRIMVTSERMNSLSPTESIDTKIRSLHAESIPIETGTTLNGGSQTDDLSPWNGEHIYTQKATL